MKLKSLLGICFAFSITLPGFSYATIVDGYFKGTIYGDDSTDGVWSGNLRGKEFSAHFWWDSALATTPDPTYPYSTYYRSESNVWLNLVFYIDGKTIDISSMGGPSVDPSQTIEVVSMLDGVTDGLNVHDEVMKGDFAADIVQVAGYVNIAATQNFLINDSLEQSFSWHDDGNYSGTAGIWNRGRVNGVEYSSLLEMYVSELNVSVREPVEVPEPSGLILFGVGMLGLLVKRRKKSMI